MKYLVIIGMAISLFTIFHCSSRQIVSETIVTSDEQIERSQNPEETYQWMRSKWTVNLSPTELQSEAASSMGMPRGMQAGGFPVRISATMMDEQLIEAGLNYYEKMTEMTAEEAEDFRKSYRKQQNLDQYFLIEVSMQTSWVEEYLDLNRWTIYIADDLNNQHEAVKVVEKPIITQRMKRKINRRTGNREPMDYTWTSNQKNLLLYFSRKSNYDKPTLHKDLKALKIVFILEKGGIGRAEGRWIYQVESYPY